MTEITLTSAQFDEVLAQLDKPREERVWPPDHGSETTIQLRPGRAVIPLDQPPTEPCPQCHGSTFAKSSWGLGNLTNCHYCEPPDHPKNGTEENAVRGIVPARSLTIREADQRAHEACFPPDTFAIEMQDIAAEAADHARWWREVAWDADPHGVAVRTNQERAAIAHKTMRWLIDEATPKPRRSVVVRVIGWDGNNLEVEKA